MTRLKTHFTCVTKSQWIFWSLIVNEVANDVGKNRFVVCFYKSRIFTFAAHVTLMDTIGTQIDFSVSHYHNLELLQCLQMASECQITAIHDF